MSRAKHIRGQVGEKWHGAIVNHDLSTVESLIACGVSLEARHRGITPLMYAVDEAQIEMFEMLLLAGANPWMRDPGNGDSLIHVAAKNHCLTLVTRLHEFGFSIDDRNDDGRTPLLLAAFCMIELEESAETALWLISQGASVKAKSFEFGFSAMHEACQSGQGELVLALLNAGASLTEVDSSGATPIDRAIMQPGREAFVGWLRELL